nr:hypothetical protein [Cressdnaviricota sp.]
MASPLLYPNRKAANIHRSVSNTRRGGCLPIWEVVDPNSSAHFPRLMYHPFLTSNRWLRGPCPSVCAGCSLC